MSAREEIFSAIRARRKSSRAADISVACNPAAGAPPDRAELLVRFEERAKAAAAQVRLIDSVEEIPVAVAGILRSRNLPAVVHVPPDPLLKLIDWNHAPGLSIISEVPGGDEVAVNFAPFAIAETGTLVYTAATTRPPSWHFRPGVEIALLDPKNISADLESVLKQITSDGALPSTVNLVTGPSRTGDIEQTLELGAHGPRELIILIVRSFGSIRD